eukprot:scaffold281501_cov39-Tisochrysis_lutea.AAC.2
MAKIGNPEALEESPTTVSDGSAHTHLTRDKKQLPSGQSCIQSSVVHWPYPPYPAYHSAHLCPCLSRELKTF